MKCRIAAAVTLDEISRQYHSGKGLQRFRDWQDAMMDNAMVLVLGGILTYDKLMERVQGLEEFIARSGGTESAELDTQDRLKLWLNGTDDDSDDTEVVN